MVKYNVIGIYNIDFRNKLSMKRLGTVAFSIHSPYGFTDADVSL